MLTNEQRNRTIEKINAGEYNQMQLERLYTNAIDNFYMDISHAAKNSMKVIDKRSYIKRFEKPIKVKVESIMCEIFDDGIWGNITNNTLANRVKVSGNMIGGRVLAEWYYSFKFVDWRTSAGISVCQVDDKSPVQYKVKPYDNDEYIFYDNSEIAIKEFNKIINDFIMVS